MSNLIRQVKVFSVQKKDLCKIFAWQSLNNQNECSTFAIFLSLCTVPNGNDDSDELFICGPVTEGCPTRSRK